MNSIKILTINKVQLCISLVVSIFVIVALIFGRIVIFPNKELHLFVIIGFFLTSFFSSYVILVSLNKEYDNNQELLIKIFGLLSIVFGYFTWFFMLNDLPSPELVNGTYVIECIKKSWLIFGIPVVFGSTGFAASLFFCHRVKNTTDEEIKIPEVKVEEFKPLAIQTEEGNSASSRLEEYKGEESKTSVPVVNESNSTEKSFSDIFSILNKSDNGEILLKISLDNVVKFQSIDEFNNYFKIEFYTVDGAESILSDRYLEFNSDYVDQNQIQVKIKIIGPAKRRKIKIVLISNNSPPDKYSNIIWDRNS